MKILNLNELAKNDIRKVALELAETGLEAIDTESVINKNIFFKNNILDVFGKQFKVDKDGKFIVIGVGKCAINAVKTIQNIFGDRITDGIVLDIKEGDIKNIKTYVGTHPFPSEQNVEATKEIISKLKNLKENDFVFFVISGGGSTLLCQPENFSYENEQLLLRHLFSTGATIEEINTVRKHISFARGGYLAKDAYPAQAVSIIFSDVLNNDLGFVSSGPTVKDLTTIKDAQLVLDKYDPARNFNIIYKNLIETPKEDKYFERVANILAVDNNIALNAMKEKGIELGFKTTIVSSSLSGEARDVGAMIAKNLHDADDKSIFLYGGETTVTISNENGVGGRNQEVALGALLNIYNDELVMSVASDGIDNTSFGGAFCDILTKEVSNRKNLAPEVFLKENRSYDFFSTEGDYLMMGDTGSNVSDLMIGIKYKK